MLSLILPYFSPLLMIFLALVLLGLVYFAAKSDQTWIFILFLLLPIRDFHLASLFGGAALKIGDIFIAYLFLLWIITSYIKDQHIRLIRSKIDLFIILFIGFYIASLFWTSEPALGLVRVTKFIRNFMFYILLRELFIKDFKNNYRKLTYALIITSFVIAVVYIIKVFQDVSLLEIKSLFQKEVLSSIDMGFARKIGTGGGVLITGPSNWLVLTAVFTFGSLIFTTTNIKKFLKIAIIPFMFFIASIVTLTRSSMVMVAVIILTLLAGSLKIKIPLNKQALAIIIILFISASLILGVHQLVEKRFSSAFKDTSWLERTELAKIALKGFQSSPLKGIGAGANFSWQSLYYVGSEPSRYVDNLYLTILSEVGSIGFALFLIILFLWLKYLVVCIFDNKTDLYLKNIALAIFAFSVSYLCVSLIGQEFESFEAWIMIPIASAIRELRIRHNLSQKDNTTV